jgi:hypothetical protein
LGLPQVQVQADSGLMSLWMNGSGGKDDASKTDCGEARSRFLGSRPLVSALFPLQGLHFPAVGSSACARVLVRVRSTRHLLTINTTSRPIRPAARSARQRCLYCRMVCAVILHFGCIFKATANWYVPYVRILGTWQCALCYVPSVAKQKTRAALRMAMAMAGHVHRAGLCAVSCYSI